MITADCSTQFSYLSLQSDPAFEDSSSVDGRDASLFGDGIESIESFCKHFEQTPWLMLFAFVKNCLPHLTHSSCGSPGEEDKIIINKLQLSQIRSNTHLHAFSYERGDCKPMQISCYIIHIQRVFRLEGKRLFVSLIFFCFFCFLLSLLLLRVKDVFRLPTAFSPHFLERFWDGVH